jgi:hypothetical protein
MHGLIQALPALLKGDSDCSVVPGGGAGAHPNNETAAREEVDGGQALGQSHRPAHSRQRHRGGQGYSFRDREHRCQRRWAIEPRAGKKQVVVRREGPEAQVLSEFGILQEAPQRPGPSVQGY